MIVIDTHVLLWWTSSQDGKLTKTAVNNIEANLADGEILISAITSWEIGMLLQKGRLVLSMPITDWLAVVASIERIRFVPVDNDIAVHSTSLPGEFHKDPADRMIVATARHFNAPLITADEKIQKYEYVQTLW
jgi:PIN domain nuclease of toxin-antitoxin system